MTSEPTSLPRLGPAWAGSLMGTSIAASLTHAHGWPLLPEFFLIVAAGIFLVLSMGWWRWREPGFGQAALGAWGMAAMGILALGSAASAISGWAGWQIMTWWVGLILGVFVCVRQLRGFPQPPAFTWGLALVAPMVAATGGGQLAEHGQIYRIIGICCFLLSLVTAIPTFIRVYRAVAEGAVTITPAAAATTWIPLGIVGQSTAAAQVLFGGTFAAGYGWVVLALGIPLALFAISRFYPAVANWAAYNPAWWGSTFPVGTLSLGTHLLAHTTGVAWLDTVSQALLVLLLVHWGICVLRWGTWLGSRNSSGDRARGFPQLQAPGLRR